MIVATKTYETTDPTINSQIVALQGSGADVLLTAAIPKFAAQAIRKVVRHRLEADAFLHDQRFGFGRGGDASLPGSRRASGIISAGYLKDPTDPQWQNSPEYKEWLAWMKKYYSGGSLADVQQRLRLFGGRDAGGRA